MKKKKALPSFLYLVFIVLLPWGVSFSFNKFTDFFVGFHSTRGWELLIRWVYNNFGWAPNELIFTIFVCSFPVILDTCLKFWVFFCLHRLSPSLVVIYHSISEA
ncbi:hypothetical protein PAHAL_8G180000 [Panicum hallii]|uniref:Chloroplast envelope membrane protein n=1 Tax=Panicum hallii TaxID=206008 RepID=A0A2T8I9B5_9POAL|nr:hypothetical protein PAHAL_8G180000 [Panicum hallii]